MQRIGRAGWNPLLLFPFAVLVGVSAYAVRLYVPVMRGGDQPIERPHLTSLPHPVAVAPQEAKALELPHRLDGYRLVSVVPAVPGHDLHALFEADHHISLFIREAPVPLGEIPEVGHGWDASPALAGHHAFQRTDVKGRTALAWLARGKRHIVTGDVPLTRLRHFAETFEKTPGLSSVQE